MSAVVSRLRNGDATEATPPERRSRYVLLTVKEAAAELGKTEAQLRWMMHTLTAPTSAFIGGRRMFRLSDIEDHIDAAFAAAESAQFTGRAG